MTWLAAFAKAQPLPEFVSTTGEHPPAGWHAFADLIFLRNALITLTLAAVLGLLIGYQPNRLRGADTLEVVKSPKVYTLYAVIGAIIGIMVLQFGLVIGFVVFGIGGLIRFRTDLRSASLTGQVILVTLIGLSCGLNLPHVAVLATLFGFVLIFLLDARLIYRIEIHGLRSERIAAAAVAYRKALEKHGCQILSEKKSPAKERLTFVFKAPLADAWRHTEEWVETAVEPELRGVIDWEIE
jgi:hypothetical protein